MDSASQIGQLFRAAVSVAGGTSARDKISLGHFADAKLAILAESKPPKTLRRLILAERTQDSELWLAMRACVLNNK